MKRLLILAALALILPLAASAQGTSDPLEKDFATRTSLALDYRIVKGFHLEAAYELRTENNLSKIDRHQASLGLSYKFTDWLKAGADYIFIYRQGASAWEPRHRADAYLTFDYKFGFWRLSLREQLRYTHKTQDLNPYQENRNPLTLKSRLKLQYKGWLNLEPYAAFEVRNTLNAPSFTADWNDVAKSYSNYEFLGYKDIYINRLRGTLGIEWTLSPHSALDIYTHLDSCRDKDIDTNKKGTKLKSFTWSRTLIPTFGLGYTFSF